MPSPIAHLAAGAYIAGRFTDTSTDQRKRMIIWAAALFFSIAPDLDAIPGLLTGNMSAYHNQATHSIFFGLAFCLMVAFGGRWILDGWSYSRIFIFVCTCYGVHLAMDVLTLGPGLKLLWPLSDERYTSPLNLFYGVRHSSGFFSFHHIITLISETGTVAAFVIISRLRLFSHCRNARPDNTGS
jgi:membrane-bound metal-dependent hydrolase YbcI (DUF457 family)